MGSIDADETQYEIEEIDLPASFDSAILVRELQERTAQHDGSPHKRPRSPSVSPPPELRPERHEDLVVPTGGYLQSETYGASRFGEIGEFKSRKRQKLKMQDENLLEGMSEGDGHNQIQFFKGLSIYINGHTEPSHQELRSLILKYGGVYQSHLDRKSIVTHIITTSLTPAKVREFKNMKVITPAWLTDSVERGALLNWRDYVFRPGHRLEGAQGRSINQMSLFTPRRTENPVRAPPATLRAPDHSADLSISSSHEEQESSLGRNSPRLVEQHESQDDLDPSPLPPNQLGLIRDTPSPPPPNQLAARGEDILTPSPEELSVERFQTPPGLFIMAEYDQTADDQASATETLFAVKPTVHSQVGKGPDHAVSKSNQDAQRVMADANWRAAHTSAAPDFIEGYYKNSRLHHLSTWKAELRALVQEAQERAENGIDVPGDDVNADGMAKFVGARLLDMTSIKGKGRQKIASHTDRVIMHCDFDSFFVAVGLLERPELIGKPVAVCHSQGTNGAASSTSEIASASYEARKFGVKGGMSLRRAQGLCPGIITIPYEFEKYKRLSLLFYTIMMSYADDLQAVSVDEALLEVTSRVRAAEDAAAADIDPASQLQDQALALAEVIRARVKHATGCIVSIGISHNIMLARLATRKAKPDGAFHLLISDLPPILAPLDLDDLHGFGHSAKQKAIEKLGSAQLQELMTKSKYQLCEAMGKTSGETLYNALRGVDERKLESNKQRKSVSCDINYGIRFENDDQAEVFVRHMAEEVSRRMDAINVRGASLTLKIMKRHPDAPIEAPKFMGHGRCETFSKQSPLSGLNGRATGDPRTIGSCALKLLRSFRFDCKELRGLAIQIQKLESATGIAAPQSGQARLTFKQAEQPLKAGTSTSSSTRPPFLPPPPPPPPPIPAPAIFDDQIKNGLPAESNPPRAAAPPFDLPSFSQVDPSVLDALPDDIRQELNAEYHRRSRSRSITPAPRQVTFKEPAPIPGPSKRIQVKGVSAVQRTIHQLSPKKSTVQSPTKSWSHKGTGFSALDLTDDELIKLDIDVEFFRALPRDIQRDQIAYVRHLKSGKPLPSTAPRKVLKVPKFKRPAVRAFAPPPRPKANLPPPASIKQAVYNKDGTRRKVFLHAKEDIEDAIETWVNSFRTTPPNSSDVEFFAKFLLKSVTVNKREGTDGGVETAVRVMHWWQLLLRQGWKASEHVLVAEEGGDSVGIAWWKAFHDVKTRLNDQTRNRFGGSIVFS